MSGTPAAPPTGSADPARADGIGLLARPPRARAGRLLLPARVAALCAVELQKLRHDRTRLQAVSKANPLSYQVDALRGLLLGTSAHLAPDFVVRRGRRRRGLRAPRPAGPVTPAGPTAAEVICGTLAPPAPAAPAAISPAHGLITDQCGGIPWPRRIPRI